MDPSTRDRVRRGIESADRGIRRAREALRSPATGWVQGGHAAAPARGRGDASPFVHLDVPTWLYLLEGDEGTRRRLDGR